MTTTTPKITVHIAPSGTGLSTGGSSVTGHMWVTLTDEYGNETSYGFGPKTDGDAWGPGKVTNEDDTHYIDPPYNYTREITPEQYDRVRTFAENAKAESDQGKGRWEEYSGVWNSCVDFTWEALNKGGLTDTPEGGWQGNLLPWFNRGAVEKEFMNPRTGKVSPAVRDGYTNARTFIRRDPLVLDLDGDGLETVGTAAGILFDHDGDGIKTGSGWVKPDDGFLVWDRNGNEQIDDGRELFGDATIKSNGQKAIDGFDALNDLDVNHDGKIDNLDAAYSQLGIWQDANQNGITDSGELKTLAEQGIASINTAAVDHLQTLPNGNQLADLGRYTRTDGSSGTTGVAGDMADINLAEDTFHRQFSDSIPLGDDVINLPTLQGSGKVRDLQEAASIDTPAGNALQTALAQFASATTRSTQWALLDSMLLAWADTSDLKARMQDRNPAQVNVVWSNPAQQAEWEPKLHILEAFNGRYFFTLPGESGTGAPTGISIGAPNALGVRTATINLAAAQIALLQQSFDALTESVYASLALQTRLKPYLDQVQLSITETGIRFDFTQLNAALDARLATDQINGLTDLIEFGKYAQPMLIGTEFDAWPKVENILRNYENTSTITPAISSLLTQLDVHLLDATDDSLLGSTHTDVVFGGAGNDRLFGADGNDVLKGGDGNDSVYGGNGANALSGGAGNDYLSGGTGNDILDGGAGSDYLYGADGNDTYHYAREDGQDSIDNYDLNASDVDQIILAPGIQSSDLLVTREGDDLKLQIGGTNDSLRVRLHYQSNQAIDEIIFADGTSWDQAAMDARLFKGTAYDDTMSGTMNNDTMTGADGNDILRGSWGNDTISGGAGSDQLLGDGDDDILEGGSGDDLLYGGTELLNGSASGNDTYRFKRGDGQDTIYDNDVTAGNIDTVEFIDVQSSEVVAVERQMWDLVLKYGGSDAVRVAGYFSAASYRVEQFKFSDGVVWQDADIKTRFVTMGTAGNDLISAIVDGPDRVYGFDGDDTLQGGAFADRIEGGMGNDAINGGNGADTLYGNEGDDTVSGMADDDAIDGGAGNDTLIGGAGNDTLVGGQGNDLLDGGTGNDVMQGGSGDDVYVVDAIGDAVTENLAEGYDTVKSSVSYTLGNNQEKLMLTGIAAVNGTGNALDNQIIGNGSNNVITGGLGNDYLAGGSGNDTYLFNLGDGQDTIEEVFGGSDNTLQFGAGIVASDVKIRNVNGDLILSLNGTADQLTVKAYFAAPFAPTLGQIKFAGGAIWTPSYLLNQQMSGTNESQTILGSGGADYIDALGGDDVVVGDIGSDEIHGGDGNDILSGGQSEDFLFGDAGNDTLNGGEHHDVLYGGDGNDQLYGWEGDDWLTGGAGADVLVGGEGSDVYFIDDTADTIIENGMGVFDQDSIVSSISFDLANATNIEGLALTGDLALTARGTNADENFGANYNAATQLIGGGGNDTYSVRYSQLSGVIETANNGNDTVIVEGDDPDMDGKTIALADLPNIENIRLTRTGINQYNQAVFNTNLRGNAEDNRLIGNNGANIIYGEGGNDFLQDSAQVDLDDDQLYGGDGNDVLESDGGFDTLDGGAGNDTLIAAGPQSFATFVFGRGYGSDTVVNSSEGGSKVRLLAGVTQQDIVATRSGKDMRLAIAGTADELILSDFFLVDPAQVATNDPDLWSRASTAITEIAFADGAAWSRAKLGSLTRPTDPAASAGNDFLKGTAADDVLNGLSGNDVLVGLAGNDALDGGAGDDILIGDEGDDLLIAGGGTDWLEGGAGSDTASFSSETADLNIDLMVGGVMRDETYIATLLEMENAIGGDGNDTINGNALANRLDGGAGNDVLRGGAGDVLIGGAGADEYQFTSGAMTVLGEQAEDVLRLNYIDASQVSVLRNGNDATILVHQYGGSDELGRILLVDQFGASGKGVKEIQIAPGGSYDTSPVIWNAATLLANAVAAGTSGDDNLIGSNANNVIDGLAGNDTIAGRGGDDTLYGGMGDDTLLGEIGKDTLDGGAGNDVLDGGVDSDTMTGGAGNDTYFVDNAGDVIVENSNEGIDTVNSSVTHTLGANVENLNLTGTTAINGTGNTLDNGLIGNSANNTLTGGAGNDTLDGGAGADTMVGGTGNDSYVVDNAGDVVTESANAGTDTIQSSITTTLGTNVENLTLTGTAAINGTGNTLNNTLAGNSGNNLIDGGAGADTMMGGAGNDTYTVDNTGDVVTENANEGTDLVQSGITTTLGANVENLTLTGTSAINGTGNTLDNLLIGNSANNTLTGGAGNDTLNGGVGADTMIGGTGNDSYIVDNTGDIVTENASEGTDTVNSGVTYTLGNNVENLTLTGSAVINGTGNTLNNILTGNSGNNILNGGSGADTMSGGLGNDTYVVDNTGDVITENANEGTDLVQSSVTWALGANLENLTLTGTAAINATGNTLNNILTGNSGNNVLDGGAGADTMVGGVGNDTYVVDNVSDIVTENANEGTDTVNSGITWTLGSNVENLTLTGTAAINGTGNTLNNILTGNSGNNTLNGGTGADTMIGGAGNDTYVVDNTGDVVTENINEGTDLVQSSVTYTLSGNVENLTLTGTSAINGTGNTLNNVLTGNSAVNTLTGGAGDDTLDGGIGADKLLGGTGNDTYVVDNTSDVVTENVNEGTDIINSSVTYTLGTNIENLTLTGTSAINGTGNTLNNVLVGNSAINTLTGGAGDDILDGGAGADKLLGGTGNDIYFIDNTGDVVTENASEGTDTVNSSITWTLGNNLENLTLTNTLAINGTGNSLANILTGNSAVNSLSGGAGNDTLNGGLGNDTLTGGTGNDSYLFARGDGADTLVENDATAGNSDLLRFMAGVANDQLWFRHIGNNLEVSVIGTSDKMTVKDWYLGDQYKVETIKTDDSNKALIAARVENLVQAMASFSPPAAGQTTLPASYQSTLNPVIAANWQ